MEKFRIKLILTFEFDAQHSSTDGLIEFKDMRYMTWGSNFWNILCMYCIAVTLKYIDSKKDKKEGCLAGGSCQNIVLLETPSTWFGFPVRSNIWLKNSWQMPWLSCMLKCGASGFCDAARSRFSVAINMKRLNFPTWRPRTLAAGSRALPVFYDVHSNN